MVPVARIWGGGGAAGGPTELRCRDDPAGIGRGLRHHARPLGVYVIRNGMVSWQPAVDVTRIVIQGQLVAVAGLLVARSLIRRRHRR